MAVSLQWFGTATWRLEVDGYVAWLDAYLDRAPTAAPLPYTAGDVMSADLVLIGHSHFDHIAEAGQLVRQTGATLVGSPLSCEIAAEASPGRGTLLSCVGGDDLRFGPMRVRTFPSLHGFNGLREWPDPDGLDRSGRVAALRERDPALAEAALGHLRDIPPKQMDDGGPLAYLLDVGGLRIFWHDTPGMVTSSWEAAAALGPIDLAIFAAAAAFSTPNVDGQPFEAGQQPFVAHMTGVLRPRQVLLNHHDDWCPPITFHLDEEGFRDGVEAVGAALVTCRVGGIVEL